MKEQKTFGHIKVIEFEEQMGPCRIDKVALFNFNRVTTDEAIRVIRAGEYSENVLVISKSQWISLFKDGRE